jgi:hypothetical protein
VGLERGPLSLVRITEELLEWKNGGSGSRKFRLTAVGICCTDHATSPTSDSCSVAIVRLRTKATEFSLVQSLPITECEGDRAYFPFQVSFLYMAYGFVGAGFPEHYDRIRPIVHPL